MTLTLSVHDGINAVVESVGSLVYDDDTEDAKRKSAEQEEVLVPVCCIGSCVPV